MKSDCSVGSARLSSFFRMAVCIIHTVQPQNMLAPSTETTAAMPLKTLTRAKVDLIAWDPESPAHAERMVQHRIACGWKQDYIEGWRILQREGKMGLQWVVSFSFFFGGKIMMSFITPEKKQYFI